MSGEAGSIAVTDADPVAERGGRVSSRRVFFLPVPPEEGV